MKRRGSLELWTVTGLAAAAILIRATRLTESLWYDEIAAWFTFGVLGPGGIVSSFTEPANHVAHTLLSWCSVQALQEAIGFELALRVPAFIFSAGSVVVTAMLARVALGRRAAVLAAGIMAVSPVAVLEGVEARGYSMMIFCSALASWALLANLERERWWRWLLYAAACALGIWAHFVTAFVPIGHAAWLAWIASRRGALRGWVLRAAGAVTLAAVLALALYAPALDELLANRGQYGAARGDEPRVLGAEGWHMLLQIGGSWYVWAAVPGLALAAVGFAACARVSGRGQDAPGPQPADAVAVTLAGLPIMVAVVLASGSWMYARFALFALPGAVLLMAAGIEAILAWRRVAGVAAAAVLLSVYAVELVVRPPKQPLRDAAEFVRRHRAPGEPILVVGIAHRVMDLYLADLEPRYSLMHGADLRRQLVVPQPAWVIVYYPRSVGVDRYALLEATGYAEAAHFDGWVDWTNGDVIVYTLSGQPRPPPVSPVAG